MELFIFALIIVVGIYFIVKARRKAAARPEPAPTTYSPPVSQYKAPSATEPYPDPLIRDQEVRNYARPASKPAKSSRRSGIAGTGIASYQTTSDYGSSSSSSSSCDSGSSSSGSCD